MNDLIGESFGPWVGFPAAEDVLDEVDALLQTVHLHQGAHFFFAPIEDKIHRGLLLLLLRIIRLVLLKVQLSHD